MLDPSFFDLINSSLSIWFSLPIRLRQGCPLSHSVEYIQGATAKTVHQPQTTAPQISLIFFPADVLLLVDNLPWQQLGREYEFLGLMSCSVTKTGRNVQQRICNTIKHGSLIICYLYD